MLNGTVKCYVRPTRIPTGSSLPLLGVIGITSQRKILTSRWSLGKAAVRLFRPQITLGASPGFQMAFHA